MRGWAERVRVADQQNGDVRNFVFVGCTFGKLEVSIPRDRHGRFEPQLIAKYQRRFPGFDEKIISLYARGLSTREIQAHLRELYEISPELVSAVTDGVLEEIGAWQNRPLESVYAIVFFDALRVKIRDRDGEEQGGVFGNRHTLFGAQRNPGALD